MEMFPIAECPVILSPAEVVLRFGDPLSIICSTLAADVQVDFEVPFGMKQEDQPFSVTWDVEEVKEWVVQAQCFATLEGNQCAEMPHITVYSEYKTTDLSALAKGIILPNMSQNDINSRHFFYI